MLMRDGRVEWKLSLQPRQIGIFVKLQEIYVGKDVNQFDLLAKPDAPTNRDL
jgi:hypothetical protein